VYYEYVICFRITFLKVSQRLVAKMNFGTVPQNVNMMQQQPMMMTMGYGQMPNTLPLQQQTMSMPQTTPAMGFGIPQQFMPGMNMTSFGVMTVDSAPNVNMPSNPMPSTQPPPPVS